eukprot:TRINITY_DN81273_c0_g1_i1.p1 TRINITY_DN81273_c0_g1~~TRINITY_DN81273_c0_g1_i1.p1  ORF type:complete len:132 (-),score=15.77 TRINITY_DN81273_c0_g1_i1:356-751(-)
MACRTVLAAVTASCMIATAAASSGNAHRLRRPAAAKTRPDASCCDKCPGRFCSPDSGKCYSSKSEAHYLQCPGFADAACCDRCSGGQYCSPFSGECSRSQAKDYYEFCPAISAATVPMSPADEALFPYLAV